MIREAKKKRIAYFQDRNGAEPLKEWINSLDRGSTRTRVFLRIERAESGNLGAFKRLTSSLCELRIHFGAGHRVHFSFFENDTAILIFLGGDKSTQKQDIQRATNLLQEFKDANRN